MGRANHRRPVHSTNRAKGLEAEDRVRAWADSGNRWCVSAVLRLRRLYGPADGATFDLERGRDDTGDPYNFSIDKTSTRGPGAAAALTTAQPHPYIWSATTAVMRKVYYSQMATLLGTP